MERELRAFDFLLGKIVCPHLRGQSVVQLVHSGIHLVRDLAFKVPQELAEDIFRFVVQIELIRIREKIALEAVLIAVGKVLQEAVIKRIACRRLLELRNRRNAGLFEKRKDVLALVALGNRDLGRRAQARARGHAVDKRVVVVEMVELIRAGLDLPLCMGIETVEPEQPLVLDEALLLELPAYVRNRRVFGDSDGDFFIRLCERQHIVCQPPADDRQQNGRSQHAAHV